MKPDVFFDFSLDALGAGRRRVFVARPRAHRLRRVRATLLRARSQGAKTFVASAEVVAWGECGGRNFRV